MQEYFIYVYTNKDIYDYILNDSDYIYFQIINNFQYKKYISMRLPRKPVTFTHINDKLCEELLDDNIYDIIINNDKMLLNINHKDMNVHIIPIEMYKLMWQEIFNLTHKKLYVPNMSVFINYKKYCEMIQIKYKNMNHFDLKIIYNILNNINTQNQLEVDKFTSILNIKYD